jgi:hypothetical protein
LRVFPGGSTGERRLPSLLAIPADFAMLEHRIDERGDGQGRSIGPASMKAIAPGPLVFDFNFPRKYTLLKVEVWEGAVTVRATRNTFSALGKAAFVRGLVAEGFIPEDFSFAAVGEGKPAGRTVRWIVDPPWQKLDEAMAARTRRLVLRVTVPIGVLLAFFIGLGSGTAERPHARLNELIGPRGQRYVDPAQ